MRDTQGHRKRLEVWEQLVQSHATIWQAIGAELKAATGLEMGEYDVLLRLSRAPERTLTMSDLASQILYSTSGLTRLIDRMERAGLVVRRRPETNRRIVFASMTEQGRSEFRRAAKVQLAAIDKYFSTYLSDDDLPHVANFFSCLPGASGPCT